MHSLYQKLVADMSYNLLFNMPDRRDIDKRDTYQFYMARVKRLLADSLTDEERLRLLESFKQDAVHDSQVTARIRDMTEIVHGLKSWMYANDYYNHVLHRVAAQTLIAYYKKAVNSNVVA